MDASDDEADFYSGCLTPPLSPTKTISTEGWSSPKTPRSPRKTRSCFFYRDVDAELTPPTSPIKCKLVPHLDVLPPPKFDLPSHPRPHNESPVKRSVVGLGGLRLPPSVSSIRFSSRSSPDTVWESSTAQATPKHPSPQHSRDSSEADSPSTLSRRRRRSLSQIPLSPSTTTTDTGSSTPPGHADVSDNDCPSYKLRQLPLRHSSSPLRPSQWVARGGVLSPTRRQALAQDRFVSRRPPYVARESFELSKTTDRLTPEERITRGGTISTDPFGRRLRRSQRLNDELRTLRETHSFISGRTYPNRRGHLGLRRNSSTIGSRQVSAGAVWNVGGSAAVSDTVVGVSNGRGGMLGSGTNAPLYSSMFLSRSDPDAELEAYEHRLALAFDVDQTDRVLQHSTPPTKPFTPSPSSVGLLPTHTKHVWSNNAWNKDGAITLLDAPQLRDDYYCSLLAYSHSAKCLAVGLGNFVHLWSERKGVDTPESLNSLSPATLGDVHHVTSLAFSSVQGRQAILAVGRADGRIVLWSPLDSEPRFDATQPKPISCVSFRPTTVKRPSLRDRAMTVPTEELLIGDEVGHVYFYSIEWPSELDSALFGWHGAMTLLARMTIHTQQICGLSWSPDGELFASGGNDNACHLFETKKIFQNGEPGRRIDASTLDVRQGPSGENIYTVVPGRGPVLTILPTRSKHKWELNAAVKAIAFCPWQRGLVAIGGGSNDRCIHFYHTVSGACLATIDCAAQVTSLIWSQTKREIAATFGFAQPEHPFRIALDENRALYAIAYPGGPDTGRSPRRPTGQEAASAQEPGQDASSVWDSGVREEGCIVIAASDAAIRFHEIWADGKRAGGVGSGTGLLGGSEILEGLHGIDRDSQRTIR
ncbi:WD40-repeat-containing domain protein [Massariosphaeria phaeospora]|uniref:WD40-repeat-containing domain protein n=1 Tax=Massariosphaeria phaeospora TaxID=100035 RepID=A0A7C8HZD7_9PLEO|nr:WD40-repeat-containing domain protein [Massariosphaeria phaeospora]